MNPEEFLKTADKLSKSTEEPDLRSSVSRSYYAVILFYRKYIADRLGIPPERIKGGVHSFIPECFIGSSLPEAKKIGEKIRRFKSDRHAADYTLSKQVPKNKAKDSLKLADNLIKNILTPPARKSVINKAKEKAKREGWIR